MSDNPSTIHGGEGAATGFAWNDSAELHKCEDGGGLFHRFKTLRRGTVAELIEFIMDIPEEKRPDYAIQKDGDRTFKYSEIVALYRRADFPKTGD
ncbi:hypothetical protein HT136_08570 [Novosphingobium profundi]|uniref:hypothetical protein n=1 Tax=Novosphingobium profundi TaxID=1774954 RepID=UPI001BD94D87|nr:hypothetical protein [Novosphingobium profundi]MBT0668422.1 hypothetical protein [Novosphingobium profundi]